jgi:integrase
LTAGSSSTPPRPLALLAAIREERPSGPRLVAFFGVLYYSGLRPEEAVALRRQDIELPAQVWDEEAQEWHEPDDAWGELRLRSALPDVGSRWTDDGSSRDRRSLKHRAEGESRTVPCPPPLTRLLREHLGQTAGTPTSLVFCGVQGRSLATITYRRAWDKARQSALMPEEYESPLARRPYDLRHYADGRVMRPAAVFVLAGAAALVPGSA